MSVLLDMKCKTSSLQDLEDYVEFASVKTVKNELTEMQTFFITKAAFGSALRCMFA